MARKKQKTYSEMVQAMSKARDEIMSLGDHILGVMGEAMDYRTIAVLGDLPDATIRRIAQLIFSNLEMFVNLAEFDMPKGRQAQAAEDGSEVTGELRRDSTGDCFEVWDTETDKMVGKLHDGMCIDLLNGGDWVPAKVGMEIVNCWHVDVDKDVSGST